MEAPYAVVTINLLVLLAYLVSYLLARFHFIRFSTHLRFWNFVLLIVLLSTGILGLILAIQVNLKISIASTDSLLVWHVNSGIGLFAVSILHVSRHWKYFLNLLKPEEFKNSEIDFGKSVSPVSDRMQPDYMPPSGKYLKMAIVATGVSAMATQLVVIKVLLSVFNGNELVIGVLLANWMLLTGIGAFAAQRKKGKLLSEKAVIWGIALLSFISLSLLFLIYFLRNIIFIPGSMVGIWQIAGASFVLLAPFCLWSGCFFIFLSSCLSEGKKGNRSREAYMLESIGGLIGGGLFSFLFVYYFHPFQSLILLGLFNLVLVSFGMVDTKRNYSRLLTAFLILVCLLVLWFVNPDRLATRLLYPGQQVLEIKDTPFSRLVVTQADEQINFYSDGSMLFATNNTINSEETVHYAMAQLPNPKKVLLIGGGISGTAGEILKYPIQSLTYVELDPDLIRLGEKYSNVFHDKRLHIVCEDARILIHETSEFFDVAIIDQPLPQSMQINRFYSLEFFKLLKSKLAPGAVVSFGLMPTAEYVGEEALQLHSVMLATLKQVFRNVLVITGDRNYMLASDDPLQNNIASLIEKRNIKTEYVNAYYLNDQQLTERSRAVMKRINVPAPTNHDLKPVAYYLQQNYWLSHFRTDLGLPLVLIIVLAFILIFRMNTIQTGLFISGFSAASVEVLLILSTQVLYGYIYRTTGIIITAFMSGLALGTLSAGRKKINIETQAIFSIQFLEGAFILVIWLLLVVAQKATGRPILVWAGIPLLMLIMAYITGRQFGMATCIQTGEQGASLSQLYSADLAGAALGALVAATLLVPVLGFYNVLLLLAGINFAGGLAMFITGKWRLL
jgi:spermidine synthase